MDPVIASIVTALVLGATEAAKGVAAQAVKEAYEGLKTIIKEKYSQLTSTIDSLHEKPSSVARQTSMAEALQEVEANKDEKIQSESQKLVEMVKKFSPELYASRALIISK